MRGKITDQDLTNYALNELAPEERFYVESMLAVSEECRHDVYQLLDVGEMLKEGFEAEEHGAALLLNDDQRSRVLTVPRWQWRTFLQRAAAVAVLAGATGYAVTHPALWQKSGNNIANAGKAVQGLHGFVEDMKNFPKSPEEFTARLQGLRKPADSVDLQLASAAMTPAQCTPPLNVADMPMPMPSTGDM